MTAHPDGPRRSGAATVELAILLPFLAFLFVVAVDWSRIFYHTQVVNNCARNGAVWASDPYATFKSPYGDITAAALADAPDLSPPPTVTSTTGSDSYGPYTDCTVTYTFRTVTNFPGVPTSNTIVRTVRAYTARQSPN